MGLKKILIIDNFDREIDLSHKNIYEYFEDRFDCKKTSRLYKFVSAPCLRKYDIIYFGINHNKVHRDGMNSILSMDLNEVLSKMKKKQRLIVDQIENESIIKLKEKKYHINYDKLFKGKKILLSKHSSQELKEFAEKNNFKLEILPSTSEIDMNKFTFNIFRKN